MRIVYMGTPDFAVPSLEELHRRGHDISWVVTQPDAVRDRGKKVKFPPVKEKALELGLKVLQPEKLKANSEFEEALREARPDVIAVAAYGKLLPEEILSIPKEGCINVHASLLPRFRGAAPIQRAIMAGDEETGVTIMYMEEGYGHRRHAGQSQSTPIGRKTAAQLHDQLAVHGRRSFWPTRWRIAPRHPESRERRMRQEGHLCAHDIQGGRAYRLFERDPDEP